MAKDPWVQPHFRIKMDQKCVGPAPCLSPCAAVEARSPWGCQLPAWKAWGVAFKIYVIVGLSTCVCMYMYIYTYIYIHIYIYTYIYYILYIYIKSHDTLLTRTSCWVSYEKTSGYSCRSSTKMTFWSGNHCLTTKQWCLPHPKNGKTMMTLDRLILVIKHHFEMITPAAPFPKLNAILKMVSVHFQRRNQYYDRFGDTESQCPEYTLLDIESWAKTHNLTTGPWNWKSKPWYLWSARSIGAQLSILSCVFKWDISVHWFPLA